MRVFRTYLNSKLDDSGFKNDYCCQCSICPTTVAIITHIAETREPLDKIAVQCGVSVHDIKDLEHADDCCVESVQKLCDYFSIARPKNCLKLQGLDL